MNLYLSPAQGAKELILKLDRELKELAADMRANSGRIRVDALWEVPMRETELVDSDQPIEIAQSEGIEAVSLVIEALTSLWLRDGQSAKETLRSPGAVALPMTWIDRIHDTNRCRLELYELIRPLKQVERTRIWRAHYQLSALQALRITTILHDPLRLRFYWDSTPSMKRTSAGALIAEYEALLREIHGHVPPGGSLPEGSVDRKIAYSIEHLRQLDSHEPLSIYRHGKPHVRARVVDGNTKPYIIPTSVPFVYPSECPPPLIKPLLSYEPPKSMVMRSARAKIETESFIEAMNIHRYLPEHRVPVKDDGEGRKTDRYRRKKVD